MRNKALITFSVVLMLLIAAPFYIPSEDVRIAAEEVASEALGARVSIEALSVRLLPMPGVTIKNAVMHDVKSGVPRLKVGSGSVSVALEPLLYGQVETRGISFKDITLRISEVASGKDVRTIRIDKLTGSIRLADGRLRLPNWQARLYGGKVDLNAEISPLEGKDRTISGEAHAGGIQIRPLLADAAGQKRLSGRLSSDLKFSASGTDEKALRSSLRVDGPAHLRKGNIYQVELHGIASMLVSGSSRSKGVIAYRNLDLELQVRGRDVYAKNVRLNSDVMDATGHVAIKSNKKLNGEIEVDSLGGLIDVKLRIGGAIDRPRVLPAPSTLIGGVIGAGVESGAAVGEKAMDVVGTAVKTIGSGIKKLLDGK